MKTASRTCAYCDKTFDASVKELNRGGAKFCGRDCSSKGRRRRTLPNNTTCAYCDKKFYKSPSRKSKSGLFFCCRDHKDLAQRIGGLKEIQPDHYGDGSWNYREIAFRSYPEECDRCGFDLVSNVLEVHHIDRDRCNNEVTNLEVLCPTCHRLEHYNAKDGQFTGMLEG